MTTEEFDKLIPRKTLLKTVIDGEEKTLLFKFFMCNPDNYEGYTLCVTENLKNPKPSEITKEDFELCYNECDVIKYE